jgi:hypothetical protein
MEGEERMHKVLKVRSFIGTHDQGWEDPGLRSHKKMEVTIILEGTGLFRTLDGVERLVEAGHIVLIPNDTMHSFHALSRIRFGVQQSCKLAEAKWLLSSSNKNMKTIGEKIGFFYSVLSKYVSSLIWYG